jgi:replicative DNA helicase Mcm
MASPVALSLSESELVGRWISFFEEADLRSVILGVAEAYPKRRSFEVPFRTLDEGDSALADALLQSPEATFRAGESAIRHFLPQGPEFPTPIRIRVTGLPHTQRIPIHEIREGHLNRFLAVEGIVRRLTEVRPQIRVAIFECALCRQHIRCVQDEESPVFREPLECDRDQGGCGKPASRTRFTLLPNESTFVDSQRLEIQENPENLKGGAHPEGLSVLLTEDLVGETVPGSRLVINGILKSVQRSTSTRGGVTRSPVFDLVLIANSVERQDQEYGEIRIREEDVERILALKGQPDLFDRIVDSLAPSIHGMRREKEAIALQLFGGVPKLQPDGVRIRGDIHVLLVGDPGTAKSQLLRWVADVAPRGVYTSGKGATAAGLTAAAVKDDFAGGRWTLEAGAMVLADGGFLTVDELDKMSTGDRSSMHEALEQQSYHPSFEIMLANGEKRPIGELVEEYFQKHADRVRPGVDCEILPLEGSEGLELLSTDFHTLFSCRVARLSRHRAPDHFVRVRYSNGREILVTPEHPVFVFERGKVRTYPAQEIRPGWPAPAPRWYPRRENAVALRPPSEVPAPFTEGTYPRHIEPALARWLGLLLFHARPKSGSRPPLFPALDSLEFDCPECETLHERLVSEDLGFGRRDPGGHSSPADSGGSLLWEAFVRENFPSLRVHFWADRRIPGPIFHADEASRRAFWEGALQGGQTPEEGHLPEELPVRLAEDLADLALSLGISSRILPETGSTRRLEVRDSRTPGGPLGGSPTSRNGSPESLPSPEIDLVEVTAVERLPSAGEDWVYDVTVEPDHVFVSQGVILHNTVSVAKAGMTVTLKARCPVLAAANPKLGRFSSDKLPGEQIDLPPTLLSRFDVIIAIQDRPDQERDRALAGEILQGHVRGERREAGRVRGTVEPETGPPPPMSPDFLQKYIAYARQKVFPVMEPEARHRISDFFVDLRKQGEGEHKPVPITFRQMEALIRLTEASARSRLSDLATVEDADRAIRVMEYFLRSVVAMHDSPFDIDIITVGVSQTKRDQVQTLREIMRHLQESTPTGFTPQEVLSEAERRGISRDTAQRLLDEMQKLNEIYAPRHGILKLMD